LGIAKKILKITQQKGVHSNTQKTAVFGAQIGLLVSLWTSGIGKVDPFLSSAIMILVLISGTAGAPRKIAFFVSEITVVEEMAESP
jgi:hypothetical protein